MRRRDPPPGCTNTRTASTASASSASTRLRLWRSSVASAPAPAPAVTPTARAAGHKTCPVVTRRIGDVAAPSSQPSSPRQTPTPGTRRTAPRVAPGVTLAQRSECSSLASSRHGASTASARARASARLPTCATNNNTSTTIGLKTRSSQTTPSSTTTTTAAATRASRAPLRSTPQHHKQHVTSRIVPTRSSPVSVANMPVGDRPRQPQLSAAAARCINRTPLTPKIAAKGPPITPLAKRPQSSTPTLAGSQTPREDASTPVAAFLAHNITPRSGPRQIRVDSANTTPNGTPNQERTSDAFENHNHSSRLGQNVSPFSADLPRQTASQVDLASETNDASKFFYASDAKSIQQSALQRPASVPQKPGSTFFYANERSTTNGSRNISPPSNTVSIPLLNPNPESAASKFFYANGTPDVPLRPNLAHSASASTVSSTPRMGPSRPPTSNSNAAFGVPAQRPASPIKAPCIPTAQPVRSNVVLPTSPKRTSLVSSPPSLSQPAPPTAQRRVSIDTAPKEMGGHRRTGSVPGVEPLTVSRFTLSPNPSETASASPPLSAGFSQPAMTMASILQVADELEDDFESGDGDARSVTSPVPQSPTKSTHFNDSVSELVANARRERKVQDLEITNASLEAINRTLERQLRKQTAELRRYRRLSRAGVISGASSRVTSLALTEPPTDMSDVDEMDESQFEDEEEEEDSFDDSDLSSNDTMSTEDILLPSAKMAARRRRDEKRLQLDLTKHQELLIDSQKMNQSLKRCLDFTEVLIKEGQKALQYNIRVSDIQLGGHVLAPHDDDEDYTVSYQQEVAVRSDDQGLEPPWPKSSQDRDSGIELPTDGG